MKQSFVKIIESFRKDLSSLRTGQASVELVEDIMVESYGVLTPLKQVAAINIPEPRMIMISPWDRSMIMPIEKAILKASHLGINPVSESNGVRLVIPPLTEERRQQLAKEANVKAEKFRAEMRRLREEFRNEVKQQFKDKQISEDDQKKDFELIDQITKEFTLEIDDTLRQKESEILKV